MSKKPVKRKKTGNKLPFIKSTHPRGGRPKLFFPPDKLKELETLASVLNEEQMADFYDISEGGLGKIFKRQPEVYQAYKRGRAKAIASVGGGLLQKARDGCVASMVFYLKTQAGWKETREVKHSSEDGTFQQRDIAVKLSLAALRELAEAGANEDEETDQD